MKKLIITSAAIIFWVIQCLGQTFEFRSNDPFGIEVFSSIDTSRNTLKFNFIDTDNDGDQDLILTGYILSDTATFPPRAEDVMFFIEWQENIGDKWNPQFTPREETMESLPFPRGESFFFPDFADLNNDGLVDLIASAEIDEFYTQHLLFYTQQADESFDTVRNEFYDLEPFIRMSSFFPTLVDLDADGDKDIMMCGFQPGLGQNAEDENIFLYAKNTGTVDDPEFFGWFDNPYGIEPDTLPIHLTGGDIDLDGDVDFIGLGLGGARSALYHYQNEAGPDGRPSFSGKTTNTLGLPTLGPDEGAFFPSLVDIDGDGDLDLFLPFLSDTSFNIQLWENKICNIQIDSVEAQICEGDTLVFLTEIFTEAGNYKVESEDSSGCIKIFELTLKVAVNDTTYINEETCFGEIISIAGQDFDTSGTYELSVMSSTGCDSTIIATLDFQKVDVTVGQQGSTLTAVEDMEYAYQWLDCNSGMPIDSATSNVYKAEVSGDYAVIIMNDIGCVDTSDCYSIISTATNGNEGVDGVFQLVPNPASSRLSILSQGGLTPDRVYIKDQGGNVVLNFKQNLNRNLDIRRLTSGLYFVVIEYDGKTKVERLVVME